jgi:hypothetical protein
MKALLSIAVLMTTNAALAADATSCAKTRGYLAQLSAATDLAYVHGDSALSIALKEAALESEEIDRLYSESDHLNDALIEGLKAIKVLDEAVHDLTPAPGEKNEGVTMALINATRSVVTSVHDTISAFSKTTFNRMAAAALCEPSAEDKDANLCKTKALVRLYQVKTVEKTVPYYQNFKNKAAGDLSAIQEGLDRVCPRSAPSASERASTSDCPNC